MILTAEGPGPYIRHVTCGKIVDAGIKDANNMGAAHGSGRLQHFERAFQRLAIEPSEYDLIVTGDWGALGSEILADFSKTTASIFPITTMTAGS